MRACGERTVGLLCGWILLTAGNFLETRATAQTCVQPPAGMVSWWPGDGNANDIVDGNNGALVAGATFAPGFVASGTGEAFSLPAATNAHVSLGNPANLRFTGDFTITVWINPIADSTIDHIFTRRSANCQDLDYQVQLRPDNTVTASAGGFLESLSGVAVPDGQWSFLAVVFRNANQTVDFFVNGATVLGVAADGPIGGLVDADVQIGQANGCSSSTHFDGLIDEVEVYDRALALAEIQAIFDAGEAGKCKRTLDHFQCYEAEGDLVNLIVDLEDQFGPEPVVLVGEPKLFCNPVDKNGEGINDPEAHLTCYEIEAGGEVERVVVIANQFGEQTLEVDDSELLCVPSAKIDVIVPGDDDDDDEDDDD